MGKLPEDLHNPSKTYRIDAFIEVGLEIQSRMKMPWLVASPVFAVDAGYSFFYQAEALSVSFNKRGKEIITDAICLIQDVGGWIPSLNLCLLNREMSSEREGTENKSQEKHRSIDPSD